MEYDQVTKVCLAFRGETDKNKPNNGTSFTFRAIDILETVK